MLRIVEEPQLTNQRSPSGSYSTDSIPEGVWAEIVVVVKDEKNDKIPKQSARDKVDKVKRVFMILFLVTGSEDSTSYSNHRGAIIDCDVPISTHSH